MTKFEDFVDRRSLYVDKTLFIKEFMESENEAICILRPRRFGNSLNLWMLQAFLSFGANKDLFSRFEIGKDKDFCEKHLGKYPVIRLDLKDCKAESWDQMYSSIWRAFLRAANRHFKDLKEHPEINIEIFRVLRTGSPLPTDVSLAEDSLRLLTQMLFEIYGQKVILLIDECDAPLNSAARGNFYDKASQFFGNFFSNALKDNSCLKKACMLGMLGIDALGLMSGLNKFKTYSVADPEFSRCFGFTEDELKGLLMRKFGNTDRLAGMKEWYGGYQIGDELVMHPFSVVESLLTEGPNFLRSFWRESSTSENLTDYIEPYALKLHEFTADMISGREHEVSLLGTVVDYLLSEWTFDSILHFLVLTGYLAYTKPSDSDLGLVRVPNKEVGLEWEEKSVYRFKSMYRKNQVSLNIPAAIKAANFTVLRDLIQKILENSSFDDVPLAERESLYHVLVSTVFITGSSRGECEIMHTYKIKRQYGYCIRIQMVFEPRQTG